LADGENSAAYLLPWLRPGQDILDVGCGPGTITVDLARSVGTGLVVGVDNVDEVIDIARASALTADGHVPIHQSSSSSSATSSALDFPDASFDVVHSPPDAPAPVRPGRVP
jgi:ubiquinone/menaquinone biosynthesis C-methylase UbiE